ncbi:unnamed protein product, partial [Rotaria socialis]
SLMASRPYFQDAATDLQTLTTKEIEAALLSATKNTFSVDPLYNRSFQLTK